VPDFIVLIFGLSIALQGELLIITRRMSPEEIL
jgi:hypothetical protein